MKLARRSSYADAGAFGPEDVGGRTLDVFVPKGQPANGKWPVLLLATGLGWFQIGPRGGLLGRIGEHFNSAIGQAVAQCGFVCVAVRPRGRHLSHTSVAPLAAALLGAVSWLADGRGRGSGLASLLSSLVIVSFLGTVKADAAVLPLVLAAWWRRPWHSPWLSFAALRILQLCCGRASPPPDALQLDPVCDMAKAYDWTLRHIDEYAGDRERVFLGGYSSGGHTAALFWFATREKGLEAPSVDPRWKAQLRTVAVAPFRGVVLLSGLYDLRFGAGLVSWLLRRGVSELFGGSGEERRAALSPLAQLETWTPPGGSRPRVVLVQAASELLGLQPLERLLFGPTATLAERLRERGADVAVVTHGWTHWDMALRIGQALQPILGSPPFS